MSFDATKIKTVPQLIRYGIVGLSSNFIGYLVFILISELGVEPKLSMTILYTASACVGFFGNGKWTFTHNHSWLKSTFKYIAAHLCGYTINFLILYVFSDKLGFAYQWVQACAVFIVAAFLFVIFKHFVFPSPEKEP